jgi:hypothetical protein
MVLQDGLVRNRFRLGTRPIGPISKYTALRPNGTLPVLEEGMRVPRAWNR